jgi:hypothetical protein
MPHLECVNEQYNHYFIVDTPPSSPKKKIKKSMLKNIMIKLNEIVRSKKINKKR